jgi:hypothetical protein
MLFVTRKAVPIKDAGVALQIVFELVFPSAAFKYVSYEQS